MPIRSRLAPHDSRILDPQYTTHQLPISPTLWYNLAVQKRKCLAALTSPRHDRGDGATHGTPILHHNPPAVKLRRGGFALQLMAEN